MKEWMREFGLHWKLFELFYKVDELMEEIEEAVYDYRDEIPDVEGYYIAGGFFAMLDDRGKPLSDKKRMLDGMLSTFAKMVVMVSPDLIDEYLEKFEKIKKVVRPSKGTTIYSIGVLNECGYNIR